MKNWQFNTLFLALVMCLLGAVMQSAGNRETSQERAEMEALGANSVGGYFRTNYRLDTITNTEIDTIGVLSRNSTTANNALASYTPFLSLYAYDLTVNRTSLTGTANVKVYLDKSTTTAPTATAWMVIDSTTTTSGVGQIKISEMTGEIYRLRVKGTGTQSTSYKLNGLAKKKN